MKTDLRGTGLHPEGDFRALITKATADVYKSGTNEGAPCLKLQLVTPEGNLFDTMGTTAGKTKDGNILPARQFRSLLEAVGEDPEDIGDNWDEQSIVEQEVGLTVSHYTNQTTGKTAENLRYFPL